MKSLICALNIREWLWHGKFPQKINPLKRISKMVESFHLEKDKEALRGVVCMYKEMMNGNTKKYQLDERLTEVGRFHSTEHRNLFLYVLLDTAKYERNC